jgi:RimJ/RimL family protein N-acetyltransferase
VPVTEGSTEFSEPVPGTDDGARRVDDRTGNTCPTKEHPMIPDDVPACLASQRQRGTAAPACVPSRPRFPAAEEVWLRDGSAVRIRPLRACDAPLLLDGFARLSAQSRRRRFLGVKHQLTVAELRYLTDIDHHDHEALGAVSAASGRGVAVARYVRSADDPHSAELAATVVDEWQRRGLATELLARLTLRALRAGIFSFTASVGADNEAVIGLLRRKAGVELVHLDPGVAEYDISLTAFARSLGHKESQPATLSPDVVLMASGPR